MKPDFEADTEALRREAAALDSSVDKICGSAGAAPAAAPAPRWATAGAAELAAATARQLVEQIGTDVAATATQIRAAAEAYEEADARAAARLRRLR